jgi:hypothetical protein
MGMAGPDETTRDDRRQIETERSRDRANSTKMPGSVPAKLWAGISPPAGSHIDFNSLGERQAARS